ncbi:hypothetical protein SAY87_031722 [Trapa incisa]|uniref:Uncharacterized protein n=1 Tax=Trapa incisa TaxID=236973 RepID=A0AAN7KWI5_9MYRT|nr:hypothetical protein SAY87_031722 [Trapa incisa]
MKTLENNEEAGVEDYALELLDTCGKRKRKNCGDDAEDDDVRLMKRKEFALTIPSYLLCLGSKQLRTENRQMLYFLLSRLVQQHNWVEASGVLSVLLKATCKDRSPENNRLKYQVLMEVLSRVEGERFNFHRIKNIYGIWMKRTGLRKNCSIQDKLAIHLEFILFCLNQGDVSEAHQASISIAQVNESESSPMVNMIMGLVFYQLWYFSIPKSMQRLDFMLPQSSEDLGMVDEGCVSLDGNTENHSALNSCEANSEFQCDSGSSIMIDKRLSGHALRERSSEDVENAEDLKIVPSVHDSKSHVFYLNSTENESSLHDNDKDVRCASILPNLGSLDPCLFPIQLPPHIEDISDLLELHKGIVNDHYKDALKYMQLALGSSPSGSEALLPLIQLLLVGGQVKEALNVLSDVCQRSETALPFRLRSMLLEHFDRKNYALISSCYEHLLEKDPTCSHSISRLVKMHQLGEYNAQSLLEMIALHLDAIDAAPGSIWQEFAMCFYKLAKWDEDCLSVCLNGGESEPQKYYSSSSSVIPAIFVMGKSGKNWRLRCRWWYRRHFRLSILESDIATGDLQLITSKAACASHMYGQQCEYALRISMALELMGSREMLSLLQLHMKIPLGLHSFFQQDKIRGGDRHNQLTSSTLCSSGKGTEQKLESSYCTPRR